MNFIRNIAILLPWLSRICVKWESLVFFFRWLAAPMHVGSVMPSSQFLARAVANQIDLHSNQAVIELGGGAGSVTKALLETGIDPERLIVIENDARLCVMLRQRFPQLRIVQGDASRLSELLRVSELDNIIFLESSILRQGGS